MLIFVKLVLEYLIAIAKELIMFNINKHLEEFNTMASIAKRIKELRDDAGLTQEEFGKLFGIVKSTVSLYENGKTAPSDDIKRKICEHFKISMDFLLGITDNQNPDYSNNLDFLYSFDGASIFSHLLKEKGITIEDLSGQTGISQDKLLNWFCSSPPSIQELVTVADALDSSVDYLLGRTAVKRHLNVDEMDFLDYFSKLNKTDQRWIVGQMIDLIKKNEDVSESAETAISQAK